MIQCMKVHQQNPLCSRETVYSGGSREMDLLPESSGGLWRNRSSSGGSGETDLPPEALEKQTFLRRLRRNRPSSRASGETDFPLEPPENILHAVFSTLSAPGCSGGKPASPEPDLRAGLQ